MNNDSLVQLPEGWVKNWVSSFSSLREIDNIDKVIMRMAPEEVKLILDQLPLESYEEAMQAIICKDEYAYSPMKLTGLLQLNGKPFTLNKHRFFEPLFYQDLPHKCLLICGRQVGKSTHMAAQTVLHASAIPRLKLLCLAPQFEQVRRFSWQYIHPFIHESYIAPFITGKGCIDSVLHKTFRNKSELWFSFALLTVDRVRGLATDGIRIDEIQDLQPDFLDIIRECMSASENPTEIYTGTSKTIDNLIEQLRLQSSQAEWLIPCGCGHWNVPTVEGSGQGLTVMEMIQPEGLSCVKCGNLINPEIGQWVHKYTERADSFPSYHIPQVIVPIHYAYPNKWRILVNKRDAMSPATFINEVLGEACDEGQRLVSQSELKAAAVLPPNTIEKAIEVSQKYVDRILGVDWGGKGEKLTSLSAAAAIGVPLSGRRLECFFAQLYPALMDPMFETKSVCALSKKLQVSAIAHDVAVAGELRRSILRDMRIPQEAIINCRYSLSAASRQMVEFKPANDMNPISYYNLDKLRAVAAVCVAIKSGYLLFPQYNTMVDSGGNNILDHFLAVYEELIEGAHGSEKKIIKRNPGLPDDFIHACVFACITAWARYPETRPNLTDKFFQPMTYEELSIFEPNIEGNLLY